MTASSLKAQSHGSQSMHEQFVASRYVQAADYQSFSPKGSLTAADANQV
jgi:hypothetical protein